MEVGWQAVIDDLCALLFQLSHLRDVCQNAFCQGFPGRNVLLVLLVVTDLRQETGVILGEDGLQLLVAPGPGLELETQFHLRVDLIDNGIHHSTLIGIDLLFLQLVVETDQFGQFEVVVVSLLPFLKTLSHLLQIGLFRPSDLDLLLLLDRDQQLVLLLPALELPDILGQAEDHLGVDNLQTQVTTLLQQSLLVDHIEFVLPAVVLRVGQDHVAAVVDQLPVGLVEGVVVDLQTLPLFVVVLGLSHHVQHADQTQILELDDLAVHLGVPEIQHFLAVPHPFDHVLSLF